MRILGIDYGDARIGIAVSDPFGWTAQGLDTISAKEGLNKALDKINEIIDYYDIKKIIVGYPLNMDGSMGERTEKTDSFIDSLQNRIENNVEIIKRDERLTTVSAHRTMKETGKKASRNKGTVDKIAAVYILQNYLDSITIRNVTTTNDTEG